MKNSTGHSSVSSGAPREMSFQYPIPAKPYSSLNSRYGYTSSLATSPTQGDFKVVSSVPKSHISNYTKPASHSGSTPSPLFNPNSSCTCVPPTLEELINQFLLRSIGHNLDPDNLDYVERFENLVTKLHCQENLKFLIEIYTYEYYYVKIFPFSNTNHASKSGSDRLNKTPTPTLTHYFETTKAKQVPRKTQSRENLNSFYNKSINASIKNLGKYAPSGETVDAVFVSTIDDVDPDPNTDHPQNSFPPVDLQTSYNQAWEDMRNHIHDEEDEEDEETNHVNVSDIDKYILNSQWDLIISNYISYDAPDQVNLSQDLYDEILLENKQDRIHSPTILIRAKFEVMRLIEENAYIKFTNDYRTAKNQSKCNTPLAHKQTSTPSDLHISNSPISSPTSLSVPSPSNLASSPSSLVLDPSTDTIIPQPKAASTVASPLLSPTTSHTHNTKHKSKKKFLQKSTHTHAIVNDTSSSWSSTSSISNLLGHLKLYSNSNQNSGDHSHPHSTTHSNTHSNMSSPTLFNLTSSLHSLANSPAPGSPDTSTTGSTLKFWSKKKH